jgi:hypothetical protein
VAAVRQGLIEESDIDRAVRRWPELHALRLSWTGSQSGG